MEGAVYRSRPFRWPSSEPEEVDLLDWPNNCFLSIKKRKKGKEKSNQQKAGFQQPHRAS